MVVVYSVKIVSFCSTDVTDVTDILQMAEFPSYLSCTVFYLTSVSYFLYSSIYGCLVLYVGIINDDQMDMGVQK